MNNYVDDEYETWSLDDCSINELDELLKRQDIPEELRQNALKAKKELSENHKQKENNKSLKRNQTKKIRI